MNKKLGSLCCLLFIAGFSHAQMFFNRTTNIPVVDGTQLQLPWAGGLNYPLFSNIDLNDDGLMDLFAFDRSDNRTVTFINTGASGPNCWRYAPEYENIFPKMTGWAFLYDYNCDEKPDLFTVGFRNNSISQYINDSPPGGASKQAAVRNHGLPGSARTIRLHPAGQPIADPCAGRGGAAAGSHSRALTHSLLQRNEPFTRLDHDHSSNDSCQIKDVPGGGRRRIRAGDSPVPSCEAQ